MPGKRTRNTASRVRVHVVLASNRSTLRVCSAGNRAVVCSGTNSTFSGSFSTAAATARQKSTSSPRQYPLASRSEKPGMSSLTPQRSCPRDFTPFRTSADSTCGKATSIRTNRAAQRASSFIRGLRNCRALDSWVFMVLPQEQVVRRRRNDSLAFGKLAGFSSGK
ncbi:MAG: hypothetical protein AW07_04215 [Candidatus Accumulibacter sp. SK-11]|nr:MAG: hypothetical protein AW07_04215 [Candidatus Accumulibacter sp. SK-11]